MTGLDKVPKIFDAFDPDAPPVIPPVTVGADQLYNVPAGITPFKASVGVTLNNTPPHVTADNELIVAVGFTFIVTVKLVPSPQLTVVGTTI